MGLHISILPYILAKQLESIVFGHTRLYSENSREVSMRYQCAGCKLHIVDKNIHEVLIPNTYTFLICRNGNDTVISLIRVTEHSFLIRRIKSCLLYLTGTIALQNSSVSQPHYIFNFAASVVALGQILSLYKQVQVLIRTLVVVHVHKQQAPQDSPIRRAKTALQVSRRHAISRAYGPARNSIRRSLSLLDAT